VVASLLSACAQKGSEELYTNCKLTIPADQTQVSIGGFPRNSHRLASTGTVNVTVIMVDFPNATAAKTPAEVFAMVSGASSTFSEMSYDRFDYSMAPALQWFRMSKNSDQYSYDGYESHRAYIQEAVQLADSTVDFSNTDLLVVLADPDAQGIPVKGPAMVVSPGAGVTADGNEMLNVVTSGADLKTWGSIWLNHESTHALGLVDLYRYEPASQTTAGLLPDVGGFGYMGLNSFESNAPGLFAWERWVLGWLDDAQVLCGNPRIEGEINTLVTPLGTAGGQKAVVVPVSATKVVVVESRRANGIDAQIAKAGVVVYTVDSTVRSGYGPLEIFPKGSESDPLFTGSPRAAGESVTASGIKVEVISSDDAGDTVRISADAIWIDKN